MGWIFSEKCKSTARLDGKTAIVTGANTGIGKVTARVFAERGATVIMACRNLEKANKAAEEIRANVKSKVIVEKLDLSSLDSVREFAEKMTKEHKQIHLLINNAGVMACPRALSADGYELQLATNHLGHFLLTLLLLPTLIASQPSRIVNVSSLAHVFCRKFELEDINLEKSYSPWFAYCRSKLANILFTRELAQKLEGTSVTCYSLHPGSIDTELQRHLDDSYFSGAKWIVGKIMYFSLLTPEQGAQTTLHCALEEKLANESGKYYNDCGPKKPSKLALDHNLATALWDKSVEMVKLENFNPFPK